MASNKGDIGASRGPISVAAKLREQVSSFMVLLSSVSFKYSYYLYLVYLSYYVLLAV